MVALKKSLCEEGFKEGAEAFTYIVATTCLDWDLAFLGEHLIDQIAAWHDKWRATHPPVDEHLASPIAVRPPSLAAEPLTIPPHLPEVHPEQVVEMNQSRWSK